MYISEPLTNALARHTGRDCPKPRDYSRITCSNCQKTGHTKVRCKEPLKEEEEDADNGYGGANDGADNGNTFDSTPAEPAGEDNWGGGGGEAQEGW